MKKIIVGIFVCLNFHSAFAQDTLRSRLSDTLLLDAIEITSIRASDKAPFTKTNLNKSQIDKLNNGRDLPFVLNSTPSVVISSDAGNGIGYTGISIRGSDATRINVTLNGIPYNDAESQGTFFVNMPDITSSVNSIQIQRGIGTSSNGAGAFGATINLSTNEINKEKYLEFNNTFGSFNSWKNTIKAGTGLLHNHFIIDGRVSRISSNGYIDRATSNLQSFYVSALYLDKNNSLRFNIIGGKEKTYQAWGGVPENLLKTNRTYNSAGTQKPGEPYENETDNYNQTHYQLIYNGKINEQFSWNAVAFLMRGKGYYEEYRSGQKYSSYGLPDPVFGGVPIKKTDLVRQKWLDNYFYGNLISLQYKKERTQINLGGGWNFYDGAHYGLVKWAANGGFPVDYKYYDNPADKSDVNFYGKILQQLGAGFTVFADLQWRAIRYRLHGFKDNPTIDLDEKYQFFNPKAGISFYNRGYQIYFSVAMAHHEPNRKDYEAGTHQIPSPEKMIDWELGIEKKSKNYSWGVNFYYMDYKNQLINTGKINDVGAYTRVNTPNSFRAGIELQGAIIFNDWTQIEGNFTLSKNKIKAFTEFADDWDNPSGKQKEQQYQNTDISFSPNAIGSFSLTLKPVRDGEISFQSKYVSQQYLDNTSSEQRKVQGYFVQNMRAAYLIKMKHFEAIELSAQVNNIFDLKYESSGYTYHYFYNGISQMDNYYFPMAGRNFMVGLNVHL